MATTSFSSRDDIVSAFSFDLSHDLLAAAKIGRLERSRIEGHFVAYAGDSRFMARDSFVTLMASLGVNRDTAAKYFTALNTAEPKGVLDFHQFEVGLIALDPLTPHGGPWGAERLTYIFDVYDVNGDGAISGEEFAALITDIAKAKSRSSRGSKFDPAAAAEQARSLWGSVFGFASLADGTVDFRDFHTAVGEMRIRGTSKLFRLRTSAIHSGGLKPGASSAGGYSTPTKGGPKSRLALPPISPMMSPFSSPGGPGVGTPGKRKATLYWKHMAPTDVEDYATAAERRSRHAAFLSRAHGGAARKKVNFLDPDIISDTRSPTKGQDGITDKVINPLLLSRGAWRAPARDKPFTLLSVSELLRLTSRAQTVLAAEPTLVEAQAPFKVFGDIHGQVSDLLSFFDTYGSPQHVTGDIELVSYAMLGDFVDRGPNSLEVVSLLFALKVRYPDQILLIRGNHESADVNRNYGFYQECINRLGELDGEAVWEAVNEAFTYLPLAGLIDGEIFCCHGGLGANVHTLDDIRSISKPVVEAELSDSTQLVVRDLLWSDPTTSDHVIGIHANSRGPDVTTFGPDRVQQFCIDNGISMVARAHEACMDGYELFAAGHLVTVFSATDYQGAYENDGAYLEVTRNLKVTPKIIPSKARKERRKAEAAQAAASRASPARSKSAAVPGLGRAAVASKVYSPPQHSSQRSTAASPPPASAASYKSRPRGGTGNIVIPVRESELGKKHSHRAPPPSKSIDIDYKENDVVSSRRRARSGRFSSSRSSSRSSRPSSSSMLRMR